MHPASLSEVPFRLNLPDAQYFHDKLNQGKLTLSIVLQSFWQKITNEYERVFILLMECLSQEEGAVSLKGVQDDLLHSYQKRSPLRRSLGGANNYLKDYQDYRGISHFILAFHIFYKLELPMLQQKNIEEGYQLDPKNPSVYAHEDEALLLLKFCNYFKKRVLSLHNPHSTPQYLFSEDDFYKTEQENTYFFTDAETAQQDKLIAEHWKVWRKNLLTPPTNFTSNGMV